MTMIAQSLERIRMGRSWRSLSSIIRLIFRIFPSTVTGRIRPVIIDATERMALRSLPHIFIESFKRFFPCSGDKYSPATVRRVFGIFGIQTSLLHCSPRLISSRVAKSVFQMCPVAHFNARHALRALVAGKFGLPSYGHLSAIAPAIPGALRTLMGDRKRQQVPESFSGQIFFSLSHDKKEYHVYAR